MVYPLLASGPPAILSRVSPIAWRCILGIVPTCTYLLELVVLHAPSSCQGRRSLRSDSRSDFLIPSSYTATKQNKACSAAGSSIWNGLPLELHSLPHGLSTLFFMYSLLKTFLFARAWSGSACE